MVDGLHLCDYGCGRVAIFVYKNGKHCCSYNKESCPVVRKKKSERCKGEGNPFYAHKHKSETLAKYHSTRIGVGNSFYGKKHSKETLKKAIAKRRSYFGQGNPRYGKPVSEETRQKQKLTKKLRGVGLGEKNGNWRGGKPSTSRWCIKDPEYLKWRLNVYERDNYTCQFCGIRGGSLQAHHIKPYKYFAELKYDVSNGQTLCIKCHRTTFKEVSKWRKLKEENICGSASI